MGMCMTPPTSGRKAPLMTAHPLVRCKLPDSSVVDIRARDCKAGNGVMTNDEVTQRPKSGWDPFGDEMPVTCHQPGKTPFETTQGECFKVPGSKMTPNKGYLDAVGEGLRRAEIYRESRRSYTTTCYRAGTSTTCTTSKGRAFLGRAIAAPPPRRATGSPSVLRNQPREVRLQFGHRTRLRRRC